MDQVLGTKTCSTTRVNLVEENCGFESSATRSGLEESHVQSHIEA